jgi:hypothetical protein
MATFAHYGSASFSRSEGSVGSPRSRPSPFSFEAPPGPRETDEEFNHEKRELRENEEKGGFEIKKEP